MVPPVVVDMCVQAATDHVPRGDVQRRAALVVPVLRVDLRHGVRAEGGRVPGVAVPDAERVRAGGVPVSPGFPFALAPLGLFFGLHVFCWVCFFCFAVWRAVVLASLLSLF